MRQSFLFPCVVAILLLVGCQARTEPSANQGSTGYQNLSPSELQAKLAREELFLLDVHVPNEGYLAGTDARIPYTEVAARSAQLPADRATPIVVYCMSGRMSAIAAPELIRLGYRQVFNLDGGMLAWRAAGYQVLAESEPPRR